MLLQEIYILLFRAVSCQWA